MQVLTQRSIDATLLQNAQISNFPEPNKRQLADFQDWLKRPKYGNGFLERNPFENSYQDLYAGDQTTFDNIAASEDRFTEFVEGPLTDLWHWMRSSSADVSVAYLPERCD